MTLNDFNTITAKQLYTYRRSPVQDASFLILKQNEGTGAYVPVGDYTVLDRNENSELSEKKVMNIVSMLNGRDDLIDLGAETDARLLYYPTAQLSDEGQKKVVFFHWNGQDVSKENALLKIAEDDFSRIDVVRFSQSCSRDDIEPYVAANQVSYKGKSGAPPLPKSS